MAALARSNGGAFEAVGLAGVAARARGAALNRGMPTRALEEWKYTSLAGFAEADVRPAPPVLPAEAMKAAVVERRSEGAAADVVLYNGCLVPHLTRVAGVRVWTAADLATDPCRLAPFADRFGDDWLRRGPWFDLVNAAFAQDIALVEFEPDVRIEAPVVITCISSAVEGVTVSAPRVFARFARGSEGSIIERHVSVGEARCLSIPSADVIAEPGSRASYARVQAENAECWHFGAWRGVAMRDASIESTQISLGAALARQELLARLEGEGAEAVINGLYLTQDRQRADNRTAIEHVVGHTASSQLYKGIVAGESRAAFNGRVRIEKDAQKSSAAQLCQNLSLSKRAEIDAKPELEIFADDVKASHGATVGQLDPEQLFYFSARAIGPQEASRTLARGFARDVALRARSARIRAIAEADVDAKLRRMIGEGFA